MPIVPISIFVCSTLRRFRKESIFKHSLTMVKEVGEVEEGIVVNEFIAEIKRAMRNPFTVGGLRETFLFPFTVICHLKSKKNYIPNK